MFVLKITAILFAILAGALGRNGCRQCTGLKTVLFTDYITEEQLFQYIKDSFKGCATGLQYDVYIPSNGPKYCTSDGVRCKEWTVGLRAWRYCGNGGSVNKTQANLCYANACSVKDVLTFTCVRSVECVGRCYADSCTY